MYTAMITTINHHNVIVPAAGPGPGLGSGSGLPRLTETPGHSEQTPGQAVRHAERDNTEIQSDVNIGSMQCHQNPMNK